MSLVVFEGLASCGVSFPVVMLLKLHITLMRKGDTTWTQGLREEVEERRVSYRHKPQRPARRL